MFVETIDAMKGVEIVDAMKGVVGVLALTNNFIRGAMMRLLLQVLQQESPTGSDVLTTPDGKNGIYLGILIGVTAGATFAPVPLPLVRIASAVDFVVIVVGRGAEAIPAGTHLIRTQDIKISQESNAKLVDTD